jgi:uncharacterized protein (TIGR00297 family)
MTLLFPDPALVATGLVVTFAVAGVARWFEAVSESGFWAGISVGVWASLGLGSPGIAVLGTFFILGSAATRWRYAEKHRRGMAEPGGGARGAGRVFAKGLVGTLLAVAALLPAFDQGLVRAAFVGAFAAAAADTLGTEIGQVLGRHPFTLLPPRRAEPGTPGALSAAGLGWGLLGAAAVAWCGEMGDLLDLRALPLVAVAGLLGSVVEAAAAPLLRRAPFPGLAGNLLTTASGAALAAGSVALLARFPA